MTFEQESGELDPEKQMIYNNDIADLRAVGEKYEIKGLEGRVKFGLDPAGMMAVRDVAPLAEKIVESQGTDFKKTWPLIKDLHEQGPWEFAERLQASADPVIRTYIVLAAACQESGWPGHTPDKYLEDRQRVVDELSSFEPEKFEERKDNLIKRVTIERVAGNGKVPIAEGDVALPLAVQGYKGCVAKAREMRFAQTTLIEDSLIEEAGLVKGFGEVYNPQKNGFERVNFSDPRSKEARIVWVKSTEAGKAIDEMEPAVKRIGSGYVLTYKDENLAVDLVSKAIESKEK